jgi:tRNA uracil 4-sulfurtransferase
MAETRETLLLLRLAPDIALKSRRVRQRFVRQLVRNIRDALGAAGVRHRIMPEWSRIFVQAESPAALSALSRVFGINSYSPIEQVLPADLDEIVRHGEARYRERVAGRSFAVVARRRGEHGFTSKDIEVALGAALLPHAARVELSRPEVRVEVEVRDRRAYLLGDRYPGAEGVPLGVAGRAVLLLSGGYDSAVAAWYLLRRGVALDYVFCNLGGDAYERAVVNVGKALADGWSYGTRPRLHVIDFAEPLRDLREHVRPMYWQVVLKRLMYRAATAVGQAVAASAIVTGEAIGQVSSQTLTNLGSIEPAAGLPVLRPLLGFEKDEIIQRARAIGTASLSAHIKEYCAIAPGHPVTSTTAQRVDREEAGLDAAVLERAVQARRTLDLRLLRPVDLVAPYLFIEVIPEDAQVIDCRPAAQFRAWHLPGAQHLEGWEVMRRTGLLDKERTYVLYCAAGVESAHLAERLQAAGFVAYSFRHGVRGLLRYAQEQGIPTLMYR